jgi:hypothetical protein
VFPPTWSQHEPVVCVRKEQPIYCGKGYKAKFVCPNPACGRSTYQALNFLGRRSVVCDGLKFTKEAKR